MNSIIGFLLYLAFISTLCTVAVLGEKKNKARIEEVLDIKDWKKLIKTKTNVLIYFGNGKLTSETREVLLTLQDAADVLKGVGTIARVDCEGEGKKLCKKVKFSPSSVEPYVLKHYHNGEFNKDYDRAGKLSSIVNFMKDPTGDLPWDEDESAKDVVHFPDLPTLLKTVKKEATTGRGMLVMFYAPWCGFCKRMKPDWALAALDVKDEAIVGAIDVNKPENAAVRQKYNITGFPTILYFRNGQMKQQYEGENNREAIVAFLRNPAAPPVEKPKESDWSDEPSEVVHLTTATFDKFIETHPSVLVMFYAPWCGHCKKMKPEYVKAAEVLKTQKVDGVLAAVDATKDGELGRRFDVKGYPTVKYFKDGSLAFNADVRDEKAIVKFMKDPREPPPPPPPEKPWSEEESAVVHLTEETFKPILRKKKNALVMFYAPWCGHCKRAKPEFTAAAEELKDDPKILFAAVDCTEEQSLCKAYEVQGFPTFKKFQYLNKVPVEDYNGGRQKEDMVNEMLGKGSPEKASYADWKGITGQESVEKLTDSNYQAFIKAHDSVLVMFYAPWCSHCKSLKPEFALAASKVTKGKLAAIDCDAFPKILSAFKVEGYPTLTYFRGGKPVGEYRKGRRASDILEFMAKPPVTKDEL